jgi:homocysteine S-methyltransferase
VAPLAERSRLGAALARGEFVSAVSLPPPRGWDVAETAEAARELRKAGVTCVDVPEGPRGAARLSPLALAVALKEQAGIEPLLHYVCHDRDLAAMESDLLGAHALGVRNVLILTGDPGLFGDSTEIAGRGEVDAIGLTNVARRLNEGLDPGGNPIGLPTSFCVGVGANPAALDLELEVKRFRYKVEAGADFAVTPPLFDVSALERFLDRVEGARIPIVAGVWPLASARQAEFLGNEVPGMSVPSEILERMRRARSEQEARREGIAIAREILERLRPRVQGVQVRAAAGRAAAALEVLRGLAL